MPKRVAWNSATWARPFKRLATFERGRIRAASPMDPSGQGKRTCGGGHRRTMARRIRGANKWQGSWSFRPSARRCGQDFTFTIGRATVIWCVPARPAAGRWRSCMSQVPTAQSILKSFASAAVSRLVRAAPCRAIRGTHRSRTTGRHSQHHSRRSRLRRPLSPVPRPACASRAKVWRFQG
jgi:hypothetical protein